MWVAWRMGFFEREGLAVDLVLMRGAEKAAMALVGESVNVAVGSADAFISAVESNFNVAITAGIINRPSFFIMAKKNYKTFRICAAQPSASPTSLLAQRWPCAMS